jgi:antitoxin ParD1/3/4
MKPKLSTVNISLPVPLRQKLEQKVHRLGAYGSTSDYVRDLIRRDLAADAVDQVDQLLIEGLNSGPAVPMDAAWRRARRMALAKHVRTRTRKSARS